MSAALAEAQALHEAGDLAAAEKVYRAVADKDPAFADALIGLATIELQRARPKEALQLAEEARERHPSAGAHAAIGAALLALGRGEEAAAAYEASLAEDPDQAEAYFGLGSALRSLGRNEEALACFDRALAIDPDYPEAMVGRAATLAALARYAEARAGFAAALDFDPEFVEARCGLAAALAELDEADEAEREYGLALAANPGHTSALIDLAMLLRDRNRPLEALPLLRRALAHKPEDADLLLAFGETLEECGELAEAQRLFDRMAKDAPRSARALYVALRDRRAEAGDPLVQSLLALADDVRRLTRGERIFVHFALGKALAELAEPEQAFAHLIEGNTLRRQEIEYDEGLVLGAFDRIRSSFAGALPPARPILGRRRSSRSSSWACRVPARRSSSRCWRAILSCTAAANEPISLRRCEQWDWTARRAQIFPIRLRVLRRSKSAPSGTTISAVFLPPPAKRASSPTSRR